MNKKVQTLRWSRLARHSLLTLAAFVMGGCGLAPRTEVPIPTVWQKSADSRSKSLIVMLPGRGDRAESFPSAGFFEAIDRDRFDVVAVDAHFGYYRSRSLLTRLHDDVIVPAIEHGYESIVFVGVSMGGMGALLYAGQYPANVDAVVLLAPYLGDPALAAEIEAAGGLEAWNPDDAQFPEHEVAAWRWIRQSRTAPDPVPIFLGYGTDDRFAAKYGALQGRIAALEVYTANGGHKWTTWRDLWQKIHADLAERTAP